MDSSMWRTAGTIALWVFGGYLGLLLLVYFMQPRLIYFPEGTLAATPETAGLSYESVSFRTDDGVVLSGWFVPAEPCIGVVLFCHGNAGNMSHRLESIQLFHRLKLSTFIFDYRGYGSSEGRPSERGTYLDALAAWDYLKNRRACASGDIVVFGRSLGAAIAARLAEERDPGALIIESAFTSITDLGAELYPFLPVRLLSRYRYETIRYLGHVRCPVLVVHSPSDEIIPFRHGRRLFDAAKPPKAFLEISGSHNDGFLVSGDAYVEGIKNFLSSYIGH